MSKQPPKFEQCRCPDCRAAEEAGTNNADRQPSEATIGNLWRNDVYFDHEYEVLRSRYEDVYFDHEYEVLRSRYESRGS